MFHYDRPPYIDPNLLYGTDGQWGFSQALAGNYTFTLSPRWLLNTTVAYDFMAPIRQQASTPDVRLSAGDAVSRGKSTGGEHQRLDRSEF